MPGDTPTLHMICGKIAAGKSTLAAALGTAPNTVVISEDDWLGALYPGEIESGPDYLHRATQLKTVMGPHVADLLKAGVSVVLDFPANTVAFRDWMRGILAMTGADHVMHVLDVSDEVCLSRLHERNARGTHAYAATEEQFRRFSDYFVPPSPDEGFNVVRTEGAVDDAGTP